MNGCVLMAAFTFDDVPLGLFKDTHGVNKAARAYTEETLREEILNFPGFANSVLDGDFIHFTGVRYVDGKPTGSWVICDATIPA